VAGQPPHDVALGQHALDPLAVPGHDQRADVLHPQAVDRHQDLGVGADGLDVPPLALEDVADPHAAARAVTTESGR
jgi:hypothetical protein